MRLMQVGIQITGVGAATAGLRQLGTELRIVSAEAKLASASLLRVKAPRPSGARSQTSTATVGAATQTATGQSGAAGTTQTATGQGTAATSRAASSDPRITGAFTDLERRRDEFHWALTNGTAAELKDASEAYRKAQGRVSQFQSRHQVRPTASFGVNQRLTQARNRLTDLRHAGLSDDSDEVRDTARAVRQLEERLIRADRPALRSTLGGRLASLLFSTRINLPGIGGVGGASPLVGRLVTALGATGPAALAVAGFAAAIGAATAVTKAYADVVREGARSLGAASAAGAISGGTATEVAGLRTMGVASENIADLASSVRQARATNPFAAATFGYQLPRPFGGVDEAKGLRDVVEQIRKMTTAEQRLNAARMVGLESMIPLIEAQRRFPQEFAADETTRGRVDNKTAMRRAQDLSAEQQRLAANWELIREGVAKSILPTVTFATRVGANLERNVAAGIERHPTRTRVAGTAAAGMAIGAAFGWIGLAAGAGAGIGSATVAEARKDRKTAATDAAKVAALGAAGPAAWVAVAAGAISKAITDAVKEANGQKAKVDPAFSATKDNTNAIIDLSNLIKGGTYGGADRAAGAFPKFLLPSAMGTKANIDSLRLGFWTL